ncbi:MAG: hypothetical protein Q9181_005812 [Wetmoreana brouardii]
MADKSTDVVQTAYEIDYPKKPIACVLSSTKAASGSIKPHLIYTHGAGGTLRSDAIANFAEGFSSSGLSILCFQGNMNLQSRVKMFKAVMEDQKQDEPTCIGGRSMGARAAIMASPENMRHLVLVSYPLHTDTEVRDQILLDIPEEAKVVFISGEHDSMCRISRLDAVRKHMKCKTYRVVVQGADHDMTVKPKAATKAVGIKTGQVVAEWLRLSTDSAGYEGRISWNTETEEAEWTGWLDDMNSLYNYPSPLPLTSIDNGNMPNIGLDLFRPIMYAPPVYTPAMSMNRPVVQQPAQQHPTAATRKRGRDPQAAHHDNGQTQQPAAATKERAPDWRLVLRDPNDPSKGRRLRTVEELLALNDYTSDEAAAKGRDSSLLKYMRSIPQDLPIAEQWKEYDRRILENSRPGRRPKAKAPEEPEERPKKKRATARRRPVNEVNAGPTSPPITPTRAMAIGGNGNIVAQMGFHEQQVLPTPPPPPPNYAPNGNFISQVPSYQQQVPQQVLLPPRPPPPTYASNGNVFAQMPLYQQQVHPPPPPSTYAPIGTVFAPMPLYQQPALTTPPLLDDADILLASLDEHELEKNGWVFLLTVSIGEHWTADHDCQETAQNPLWDPEFGCFRMGTAFHEWMVNELNIIYDTEPAKRLMKNAKLVNNGYSGMAIQLTP